MSKETIATLTARIEALEAKIEELSKAKTASKPTVHPAYKAPGADERRARQQAEIAFRREWAVAHPGFTQAAIQAAIAEWNAAYKAA